MTTIITFGAIAIIAVMLIIKFAGKTDEQSTSKPGNTGSEVGNKPIEKEKPSLNNK